MASRATSMAANTASAAEDEIAWLMPEACRIFVARMRSTGRSDFADAARRRSGAHVGKSVSFGAVGDEIEPGVGAAVDDDPARVDALLEPKRSERLTERVSSDGGEIGRVGAQPRGRDHRVRRVAAEPLHERRALARLIELDERFADREQIRHRSPRRNRDRDAGHQPGGGAMNEPHGPRRA